ncbi:MAG: hypothetical protein LBV58_03050 [Acholeplasmatales bacterium]|jgi:carboxyl-terminal processing protease|nr:hypothetical protein [Acholeplasmatales bacterium]
MKKEKIIGIIFIISLILTFFLGYLTANVAPLTFGDDRNRLEYLNDAFEKYYYFDVDDEDRSNAYIAHLKGIIDSYSKTYNDPYTRLDAVDVSEKISNSDKYNGTGASLYYFEGGIIQVGEVYYGSPAYGKIYEGEQIIGELLPSQLVVEFIGKKFAEIAPYLLAKIGDSKTLVVKDFYGNLRNVQFIYSPFGNPSCYIEDSFESNIAVIKIKSFEDSGDNLSTHVLFRDSLRYLEDNGLSSGKTLVIDLRDNPGGVLNTLVNESKTGVKGILEQLLVRDNDKPVFSLENKKGQLTKFYGGLTFKKEYDIVALVNKNTASAAEVMASALVEFGYKIYGEETYGKGVYQETITITTIGTTRYDLVYTAGKWYYSDRKNVFDTPLVISENIFMKGILNVEHVDFQKDLKFNDVDTITLPFFQKFLNAYYNDSIREDGYFDNETLYLVNRFRADRELTNNHLIDQSFYYEIMLLYSNAKVFSNGYDTQLLELFQIIKTK